MKKVCLIGVSAFASVHYHQLVREAQAGRLILAGAAVINQDEEKDKCDKLRSLGCRLFNDYRAMLESLKGTADLCVIPTGIAWHERMTCAALDAGMNVLLEKPAAGTVQEVDAMIAAEKRNRRFVAIAYQNMYMRQALMMKDTILIGQLGRIHMIKSMCLWPRDKEYFTRNGWCGHLKAADRWVLDSPAQNANAHEINLMCFLAGTTRTTSATVASVTAELAHANPIDSADTVGLRVRTAEGVPILYLATHASESNVDPRIIVRGEKGTMTWHYFRSLTVCTSDGETAVLPVDGGDFLRDNMLKAVLDRIDDPAVFVCTLEHARSQVLVVNAAHQSCRVSTVPKDRIRVTGEGDREYHCIPRIDNLMTDAFGRERLVGETGVEWARPGTCIDVTGAWRFDGPAT